MKKIERSAYKVGSRMEMRVYPEISERVPTVGCYSEVMMHFGLAGKPVEVSMEYQTTWQNGTQVPLPQYRPMCQVWKDGRKFSSLILPGEGGFYEDSRGFYTYADLSRMPLEVVQ